MAVSQRLRFKVLARDNFTCRYCGRSAPDVVLHVDHVHPTSRGGTDHESNLVTACRECNTSKQAKILPIVPAPAAPPAPMRTVPHVCSCSRCADGLLYLAVDEEPSTGGPGYVAAYRCDRGHGWTTSWSADLRLEPAFAAAIAEQSRSFTARLA